MTIYVDVLIVLNTLVNYFILLAVRKITRSYTKRYRLVVGALCGGFSSLLIFLENLGFIMTVLKVISSLLIVGVTFGIKPFRQFLKRIFFLFAITFIFGGFVLAVHMLFDKDILLYSNGIVYFDVNMTCLIICSVISYIIITVAADLLDKKAPESKEYTVCIDNKLETVSCVGFMDTGNNLRDPFSGYPVVIIEKELFKRLFIDEKIRYIPVSTVNGESIMKAFKPQKLTINNYSTDKVYIG